MGRDRLTVCSGGTCGAPPSLLHPPTRHKVRPRVKWLWCSLQSPECLIVQRPRGLRAHSERWSKASCGLIPRATGALGVTRAPSRRRLSSCVPCDSEEVVKISRKLTTVASVGGPSCTVSVNVCRGVWHPRTWENRWDAVFRFLHPTHQT